jgi:hypothetical protein
LAACGDEAALPADADGGGKITLDKFNEIEQL